ncbi:PKD domain-containing protein [Halobacteriales archaeon Cl-PHB]
MSLDAGTDNEAWRFETDVTLGSDPAVGNDTVYVAGQQGQYADLNNVLYGIDAGNASQVWGVQHRAATQTGNYYTGVADGHLLVTGQRSAGTDGIGYVMAYAASSQSAPDDPISDDPEADDEPPRADAFLASETDDGYYPANTTVTVSGNASTDDGEIVSYEWDVDGDGEYEKTGVTIEVQSPVEVGATKTVALRVTDDAGQTDTSDVAVRTGC